MGIQVHLVSFTVPFPPNYGGVIDVYYKLKALHDLGCKVHLHCFTYRDRQPAAELDDLAEAVYYYPRKPVSGSYLSTAPFIVSSRASRQLRLRLLAMEYPVLLEGVHCTAFLNILGIDSRKVLVRLHNIEWQYYKALVDKTGEVRLRLHYQVEWRRLRSYESRKLGKASHLLAISEKDAIYFQDLYGENVLYIPPFHRFSEVCIKQGRGEYVLFHADLSVPENHDVAYQLIEEVFSKIPHKVVIAGRKPPPGLVKVIQSHANIVLKADVSSEEMDILMRDAQIQVVHVLQSAGFKIKLLHALFSARTCLCNKLAVHGTGLEDLVDVYVNAGEMTRLIDSRMQYQVDEYTIEKRKKALLPQFDNLENARKIISLLS